MTQSGEKRKRATRTGDGHPIPWRFFCIACCEEIKKQKVEMERAKKDKIFQASLDILHPSIVEAMLERKERNGKTLNFFCKKCVDGITEIMKIKEELEIKQNECTHKSTELTIDILKRGTKIKSGNGHLNNVNHPGKQFIILDVTDFSLRYKLQSMPSEVTTVEEHNEMDTTVQDTSEDVVFVGVKMEIVDSNPQVLDSSAEADLSCQVVDEDNHSDVTTGEDTSEVHHQQHSLSASTSTTILNNTHKQPKIPKSLVKKLIDADTPKLRSKAKANVSQQLDADKGKRISEKHDTIAQKTSRKSSKSEAPPDDRFKCHKCEKDFASKPSLLVHSRVHLGNLYTCDQCKKIFRYKGPFTSHIRTHTGEKPFKCTVCEATFSTPRSLNSHKKTHP